MTTPTDTAARERTRASGADLKAAFIAASSWLNANAERINALNVFPVPDGDTARTCRADVSGRRRAMRGVSDGRPSGESLRAAYEAAMLGARGAPGVILSQLLRGSRRRWRKKPS
jgi:dihydroxyacetone kinase-like predicted kinase